MGREIEIRDVDGETGSGLCWGLADMDTVGGTPRTRVRDG